MAELNMNGGYNADVEMKEEGTEHTTNPIQAVPPYQQEQQEAALPSAQATHNGYPSQTDGAMAPHPQEPQASVTQQSMDQAHAGASQQSAAQQPQSSEPSMSQQQQYLAQPAETPLPPTIAQPALAPIPTVAAPPIAHLQAPISAPTPPAVRESSRTSSQPPASVAPPERPNAHGAPTRVYLNQNVTPHLLEGMKYLAAYEPEKPLQWLSEFLAKRSAEMEG